MGFMFKLERRGPVYRCARCRVQIARFEDLIDAWLDLCQFTSVYNVVIAEDATYYGYGGRNDLFYGHEVRCVSCLTLFGYLDVPLPDRSPSDDFMLIYTFESDRIAPHPDPSQFNQVWVFSL